MRSRGAGEPGKPGNPMLKSRGSPGSGRVPRVRDIPDRHRV